MGGYINNTGGEFMNRQMDRRTGVLEQIGIDR